MTHQTNNGIYIPQRQLLLVLASVMIAISAAIIFSAIFVTNLVQGKVASAQAQTALQPNDSEIYTRGTTPTAVGAAWSYEDPNAGCTVPTGGSGGEQTSGMTTPAATRATSSAPDNSSSYTSSKARSYATPTKYSKPKHHPVTSSNISNSYNNNYNNSYNKSTNINNIDKSTNYSHSFNQGSYNNVKGDLKQTNINDSNVDTKIINQTNNPHKPHGPQKPHHGKNDHKDKGNGSYHNKPHEEQDGWQPRNRDTDTTPLTTAVAED